MRCGPSLLWNLERLLAFIHHIMFLMFCSIINSISIYIIYIASLPFLLLNSVSNIVAFSFSIAKGREFGDFLQDQIDLTIQDAHEALISPSLRISSVQSLFSTNSSRFSTFSFSPFLPLLSAHKACHLFWLYLPIIHLFFVFLFLPLISCLICIAWGCYVGFFLLFSRYKVLNT